MLKTGLSQDARKVWRLKPLTKTVGERIRRNTFWKQIMSPEMNISTQSSRDLSERSAHESVLPLKRTPSYSCIEGDLTDKSRTSPPVACWERARTHPLIALVADTRSSVCIYFNLFSGALVFILFSCYFVQGPSVLRGSCLVFSGFPIGSQGRAVGLPQRVWSRR